MRPLVRKLGAPLRIIVLAALLVPWAGSVVRAQTDPVVTRGVNWLRARAGTWSVGETGLAALAMLKAEVSPADPALAGCLAKIRARITAAGYKAEQEGGHEVYEAAVVTLALGNIPGDTRRDELEAMARYILARQKANGSWDYSARTQGDTSISQYAVLGLWEAENGGARVPPDAWERAATWFLSVQSVAGSWNYHRDEGGPETLSLTAAGVGSLLICQRQLDRHRAKGDAANPLLVPISADPAHLRYDSSLTNARLDQAIKRGIAWLAANFTTTDHAVIGHSVYYGLYGIERAGALAKRETLGKVNWFEQGARFIRGAQREDGGWSAEFGDVPNTAWALLFLTKATTKTLVRINVKSLGTGTLLGGRGLPKDLSSLTVAGGRVVSRPMNGAVEGMLAAMEDPRVGQADSALTGLVDRYRAEGPSVLRPMKDRFRALLKNADPGLRKVGAWALARTGDLDTVPLLIDTLTDPDESVVVIAREGLQLLSRKIAGFGPPSPSTPDQRREAAARWRAWYASIRPLDVEGQDDEATSANANANARGRQ